MQKNLLLFATAMLTAAAASAIDFSVENAEGKTIYYSANNNETAWVVEDPEGYTGEVIIPATVNYNDNEYKITAIGSYAFSSDKSLTSVTIPESVTKIMDYAFMHCTALTSINLPNTITSIGIDTFYDCGYGNDAANWTDGILYIGNYLVQSTSSAPEKLIVKDGTVMIASNGLYKRKNITEIILPNSLITIGDSALSGCTSLTSVTIPENVVTIDMRAFRDCTGLISIEIPESVTTIGNNAFYDCTALESISVNNSDPANITTASNAFVDVPTATCILYVPKGSKELYAATAPWSDFGENIEEKSFSGINETSAECIETNEAEDLYFDMMGRRVLNPTNGLYIHNGQKVLIK